MNQVEKLKALELCRQKLKRAAGFADAMSVSSISPESLTSLWQLSGEAHSAINALKSEVAGNEPPKIG